jgi:glycosyltransferase involved in cell wall biosynthesis
VALKYLAAARSHADRPALIFDTIDLHHLRELRMAVHQKDVAGERRAADTRAIELAVMHASDRVWVTSTFEAAALRAYPSLPPVDIISNIHDVREHVPAFSDRKDILFVGGFQHAPNEDAVLFFASEVLPMVRQVLPDVRLVVAGSSIPRTISELESRAVVIAGHVGNLGALFGSCRLSVAPLRFGAGVKGKVGQSLAWGLPIVTTPIGAEGMGLVDGEHALIADEPAAFADKVVQLYRDSALWHGLSTRGRDHIRQHFSAHVARDRVAAVFSSLETAGVIPLEGSRCHV